MRAPRQLHVYPMAGSLPTLLWPMCAAAALATTTHPSSKAASFAAAAGPTSLTANARAPTLPADAAAARAAASRGRTAIKRVQHEWHPHQDYRVPRQFCQHGVNYESAHYWMEQALRSAQIPPPVEADCGPRCAAFAYLSADIPVTPFGFEQFTSGFMLAFDANPSLWNEHVQCMSTTDSFTSTRVCCMCSDQNNCPYRNFWLDQNVYCDEPCTTQRCKQLAAGCSASLFDLSGQANGGDGSWRVGQRAQTDWMTDSCSQWDISSGNCDVCREPYWCSHQDDPGYSSDTSPPPPPPPASVLREGRECWESCGNRQGNCPGFCGVHGACCRRDFEDSPPECGSGTLGCTDGHRCTRPPVFPPDAPPNPPSPPSPPSPPPPPPERQSGPGYRGRVTTPQAWVDAFFDKDGGRAYGARQCRWKPSQKQTFIDSIRLRFQRRFDTDGWDHDHANPWNEVNMCCR